MFDGTYGEENDVCELGGVRHDELSLGRPVPEELRLILLGQKLDHPTLPLSAPPVDDLPTSPRRTLKHAFPCRPVTG